MSSKQEASSSLWNVPVPKVTESPGGSSSKNTSSTTATNATEPASTKDEQRIHREGIEHLKENTDQPSHLQSSAATGAADRDQPPSSNPSSEDPSGGLSGKEAGGVAAVGAGAAAAVGGGAAAAASHAHQSDRSSSHLASSPAAVPNTQSSLPQPPASNPSADDATGGIGKGQGGVSSAAYTSSPVDGSADSTEQTGILGTVKSYLGLSQGGEAGASQDTNTVSAVPSAGEDKTSDLQSSSDNSSSSNSNSNNTNSGAYGYVAAAGAAVASTAAAVQGRVTGSQQQPATSEAADSAASDKGTYLNYSGTANSPSDTSSAPTSSLVDRTVETVKQYTIGTNNSSSSSTDPTTSSTSEESGTANPAKDNSTTGRNMGDTDEQPQKKTSPTDKAAATRENKDAIPTAGGERLGEKHWGESKIVPDNPKPASEGGGAGVSSSEGQPNDETKANTAANIGSSSSPPGAASSSTADDNDSSGGKTKTLDKIKDKLNIGSKKD